MAKDRDGEALGANQSKRPPAAFVDFGDQPQHPSQQHHRVKSQKHLVGGATGGHRLHARIPSSKALHKHHASTSTAKLNRSRHGSLSPDQEGTGQALASHHHHRRATSELKLTTRDPSSSNLKSAGQANLKRNRSQAEVHKRTKSATSLHRSASNPAVSKLRSSGSSSRVQFNLGDEGQGEDDQDEDEDEWVDASRSASPLLSRRGSAVSAGQLANHPADDGEHSPTRSPAPYREDEPPLRNGTQGGAANGTANGAQDGARSLPRNQYLTSRILSRTPSHGAPPMMSAATVSVRPSSSRQPSPPDSSLGQGPFVPNTPGPVSQIRPGSSGKAELTSRFVGVSSQEPGSGIPGESFILAANRGGLSRAALPGDDGLGTSKRRQSLGAMSQARGIDALNARQAAMAENNADDDEDEDDDKTTRPPRQRQSGDYVVPREMNRTQQKLNLQRASSSLEPSHPHPGVGIGPAGVAAGPVLPLLGVPATYDSRDPRVGKMLERTGMEYLTVRRHLNPVARSIARVMQLPDLENSRRIPRPGTSHHNPQQQSQPQQQHHTHPRSHQQQQQQQLYQHHASRLSGQFNPATTTTATSSSRAPLARDSSMADLIAGRRHTSSRRQQQQSIPRSGGRGRGGGAPFSAALHSGSSSLGGSDDDDDDDDHNHHDRDRDDRVGGGGVSGGGLGGLSGSSLVNGTEDAETMALLRMLWDKNLNMLSASQE